MSNGVSVTSDDKNDFETVLNEEVGQFGKYQAVNILMLSVIGIISAFMAGDYIFTGSRQPHRCAISGCDSDYLEFSPSWIADAVPDPNNLYQCQRYPNVTIISEADVNNKCPAELFDKTRNVSCESYIYNRAGTVMYDFDLACQEWLRTLPGTLNSLGGMVALHLAGYISDYFGRRTSIVLFTINLAATGLIRAFSVNFAMYVAFQFLQTALGGGAFSAAYILATETVGPKYRVPTSAWMSSMFALGQVILGLIASVVPDWRKLTMVLYAPLFILITYRWLLIESHRWLLSKNKPEARATLEKAARMNGRQISDVSMNFLLTALNKKANNRYVEKEPALVSQIIRSPIMLRRCMTTPIWWMTTTFIYYGLSINSVSLSGNTYYNYVATAAVEIPGYWTAVLVLDRIGRKTTLFTAYLLCAFCCVGFTLVPEENYSWLQTLFYLTGKFNIAVVFTSVYLYTTELYPTKYRHSLLGFSSMLGRIGSVLAPLTPPLMDYWYGIPSIMFAFMALISACLVLTQPETLRIKLPNTIEDAEQIGRNVT